MPRWVAPVVLLLAAVSVALLAFAYRDRTAKTTLTRIDLIPDMDNQRKFRAQAANPAFEDGRAMRPEIPGTMAVEHYSDDEHFSKGTVGDAWAATMPLKVDMNLMKRGKERFGIYCAPCHGHAGDGNGMTARRATKLAEGTWMPPTDYHTQRLREMPVGQIFHTITYGVRKMPPYGAQIPPRDRWAIIAYVRALQRSQNATLKDVPDDKKELFRQ